jgi:hypothetical protein
MPSVRSLILLSVFILAVSLFAAWLSLFRAPDSNGRGHDTYGTKGYGYKGLFDSLRELGVPVRRDISPPQPSADEKSLVLLQPDANLTGTEPIYLRRLLPWIEQGGRVIVALPRSDSFAELLAEASRQRDADDAVALPAVLELLELDGVTAEIHSTLPVDQSPRRRFRRVDEVTLEEELKRALEAAPPPRLIDVQSTGTLKDLAIAQLALPGDEIQTLDIDSQEPLGVIRYTSGEEDERILVAEFARGNGRVIVVSDHALFRNRYLAQADNSVLAAKLISPQGEPVAFDEFYHGLGVRGNPLFLLTRPGYAALALGLLLFSGLAVWREAILLGPSLPDQTVDRRDIGEYLTAMGRFFSHGRQARPFLVEQVRAGVLREWCRKLSIAAETPDADMIAGLLTRKHPAAGERLRTTLADVDARLQSQTKWTEQETIHALRRLTACLSTNT